MLLLLIVVMIVMSRRIPAIDKVDWEGHCFSIVINSSSKLDRGWVQGRVRGVSGNVIVN